MTAPRMRTPSARGAAGRALRLRPHALRPSENPPPPPPIPMMLARCLLPPPQVGETLVSRRRSHQPQLAVVIGMEHMRPAHPLILTATFDPYALKQGVRRLALRSLLGVGRTANLQRVTVRTLHARRVHAACTPHAHAVCARRTRTLHAHAA